MNKSAIILSCFLLSIFAGCWYSSKKKHSPKAHTKDKFYTTTGGWDWVRVPLIKPYAAVKADPKIKINSWGIKFLSPNSLGTYNVKKVSVKDSIIYILSGNIGDETNDSTAIETQMVSTAWFVIDTRKKSEKGFAKKEEFTAFLQKSNYPMPCWLDLDSLSTALAHGKELPWQPNQ